MLAFVVTCAVGLAACVHEDRRTPTGPRERVTKNASSGIPAPPPQYLIADPGPRSNGTLMIPLGPPGVIGLVVDKTRVVVGRGEPRVAPDTTEEPITGARKIPARFGGGYLFHTDTTIYRAEAFEAPLKPLARVPGTLRGAGDSGPISFAPKYLLARTDNGERWAISLPSGDRATIDPAGVADIEGLDDGRALAFNDQGAVFASIDHGAHWNDVTAQVKTSPHAVRVVGAEVWLYESSGTGMRLESDGRLSSFDHVPDDKPLELRPRDPRWRAAEAPLRAVLHGGAAVDESTAIVIESGDLVRVDLHTGEVVSIVPGRLPPDARCEAVPIPGDVLFACASLGSAGGSAFVVSHTLSGDAPVVEQSFGTGAVFYASDDGGLAFGGPCGALGPAQPGAGTDHVVCVRQPGGTWDEQDLSTLAGDGGAGDVVVSRWVPRADGRAVAFILQPDPQIYDPRSGISVSIAGDGRDALGQGMPAPARHRGRFTYRADAGIVDWSWSYTANGTLRGWQRHGGTVEIFEDGRLTRSPYAFELVSGGPFALGRTREGRLYQSTDHGATWSEVATPPTGGLATELRSCTTAGCDLGAFYRIGWAARPPRIDPPPIHAARAPEVRRTRPVELACRPSGPPQVKVQPRTDNSPEDLGLGVMRLPVVGERADLGYLRTMLPRTITNPIHESGGSGDDGLTARALLYGYQTTREADVIEVMGPNKSAAQLRRSFAWVPAFDPAARIFKTTIAMSDVIAAGRAAGMTSDEVLSEDMTESGTLVVITPLDPNAPSDFAFKNPRGLVVAMRGERTRVSVRNSQNQDLNTISALALPGDETAFLDLESSGVGHVFKIGPSGSVDLFDVDPTANDTSFYPANPDALALGPKNEIGRIRTGSGSDPSSAYDPALVLVPSTPPAALAPWSTLTLADDPACAGAKDGWRTTLQLIAPWVRVSTPELRIDEAPMLARVRWSDKRVCLEGLEAKVAPVSVRVPGAPGSGTSAESLQLPTWIVARGKAFARVAVAEGVEWRQALECTLVPPAP